MLSEKLEIIETELVEIMDRIDNIIKVDKTLNERQKIDIILARDYIYLGFEKLKEVES